MNNVGSIWRYGENLHVNELINASADDQKLSASLHDIPGENFPLLGRRLELMIVTTQLILLDEPIDSPMRTRDLAAIIFEGKPIDRSIFLLVDFHR